MISNYTNQKCSTGYFALSLIFCVFTSWCFAGLEDYEPMGWASQPGHGRDGTTGGKGGSIDTVSSLGKAEDLLSGSDKAIVFLKGNHSGSLDMGSNKTLIGFPDASIKGTINIEGVENVIIRNISVHDGEDCIHIKDNNHHIWIDHCDVFNGKDGNMDITKDGDFITVSACKFYYITKHDHAFSNLVASSDGDEGGYNITFINNWWAENVDQRTPRTRYGKIHVVNNLYTSEGNSSTIMSGAHTNMLVEGNIFINVNKPIGKRDGGTVLARNNYFDVDSIAMEYSEHNDEGFTPPYELTIREPNSSFAEFLRQHAGATLSLTEPHFEPYTEPVGLADGRVFPYGGRVQFNARTNTFTLNSGSPRDVTLEVMQADGRTVLQKTIQGVVPHRAYAVPAAGIPAGVYLLRFSGAKDPVRLRWSGKFEH